MGIWPVKLSARHYLTYGIPSILALSLLGFAGAYWLHALQDHFAKGKVEVVRDMRAQAGMLKRQVDHVLSVPSLLAAALEANPSHESLKRISAAIIALRVGVSSLEIAPYGQPTFVYPAVGTATEQQTTQFPLPAGEQLEAGHTPTVSAGPNGMLVSLPIRLRRLSGEVRDWGNAKAFVNIDELVRAAHLDELLLQGSPSALIFNAGDQSSGVVLFGTAMLSGPDAVSEAIRLPDGTSLVLVTAENQARTSHDRVAAEAVLVLIAAMLLGALAYTALRRPHQLEQEVNDRTSALAAANSSLAEEVDERRSAEQLLEESHALLDSVFEHLPGMVLVKRADDKRIHRANQQAEEFLGRKRDLLLGRNNEEIFPHEQAVQLTAADQLSLDDRRVVDLPEVHLSLAGVPERWIHLKKVALPGTNGHAGHILELGEDITPVKKLTLDLTEHLNFLEQLLDAIPSPIFFKDAEGRYLGVNSAFERFHGKRREELKGKTVFDIAPRDLAETYYLADRELLEHRGVQVYESAVLCADGVTRDTVFYKAVFFSTRGEARGIVGVVLDITDRKKAERRIAQLNRTLGVIGEINQAIVRTDSRTRLIERVCEILVKKGEFPLAWVHFGTNVPGQFPSVTIVGSPETIVGKTIEVLSDPQAAVGVPGLTPGAESPLFCSSADCCHSALFAEATTLGLAAMAILPLRDRGRVVGGLGIFATVEGAFDEAEQRLLINLAEDLSHALESLDQEMRRRDAESGLRLAAQVFENSSEGIMITDAANRILMVNNAFSAVTGYEAGEVLGKSPTILSSGKQGPSFYREMWHALKTRGEWHGEIQNRRKNGEFYSEWLTISVVRGDTGELTHHVAVFSDITSRKQIDERLNFLANYDVLTALPNRVLFTDRLEQCIAKTWGTQRLIGVIILDLDRFKLVNETLGHAAGDFTLQEISTRLQACVRHGDSVSRLGGDEFAIVASDLDSPDELGAIGRKIVEAVRQPIVCDGNEIYTSASIGISLFPNDGEDVESLVKNAASAMYQAIEDGGNRYRFYRQEMNLRSSERMTLETKLHHALERGELQVCYQPIVQAQTGRIAGAEALLRWRRPEFGQINPTDFIPLLEETGLIIPIGEWVLETACRDNLLWREMIDPDLFIAVNFSAVQLLDNRADHAIRGVVEKLKFDPRFLEIELTESVIMRDLDRGVTTMSRLRDLGVKLSVDDFGTGYSSLAYLKRLPIDALKIDQSFIRDTPGDKDDVAIIRAIISMSRGLQLTTIAEGVESHQQAAFLRRSRCDLLQGFHFSKAVTKAEFSSLIKANRNGLTPWLTQEFSPNAISPSLEGY